MHALPYAVDTVDFFRLPSYPEFAVIPSGDGDTDCIFVVSLTGTFVGVHGRHSSNHPPVGVQAVPLVSVEPLPQVFDCEWITGVRIPALYSDT
eukprot:CAMPEP_0182939270 /NCGR_PEP_ID=MMETSP0105_2-20130417/45346_1 /TAXON_ID=81532 ORGANISM="Acanthoeca-like sp., Strain 10tr" /NCGR_SAMPLE_ID=MMETSP0105_2 /ASSEMBLY_ACC=CAM_ASM_000205 /LENGTH=92 /DNA_ID=CAMNT_0025078651 /DNA_START=146 /DNA_END=424 /DNA_ORIENTATION=+